MRFINLIHFGYPKNGNLRKSNVHKVIAKLPVSVELLCANWRCSTMMLVP